MTTRPGLGTAVFDGPQERFTGRQPADPGPGMTRPRSQLRRRRAQARSGFGRRSRWEILARRGASSVVVGIRPRPARNAAATRGTRWSRTTYPTPARLTGRGRVVVSLGLLLLMVAAFTVGRVTSAASADPRGAISTVIVQPGQSLWEIAGQVAPGTDRRATMRRLDQLNPGGASGLRPGQLLRVPA